MHSKSKSEILKIVDINEHLYNRLQQVIKNNFYISDIIDSLVTKNTTKTRINRLIINIILNNTTSDLNYFIDNPFPFVRVLGFKKQKQHLLKDLKSNANIKIVTNLKNTNKILNTFEEELLQKEINKTNYFIISNENKMTSLNANQFENKLVII